MNVRHACGLAVVMLAALVWTSAASADVKLTVTPFSQPYPSAFRLGTDVSGPILTIENASNGAQSNAPVMLDQITLVASCGSETSDPVTNDCPAAVANPNAVTVSGPVSGRGPGCEGTTFSPTPVGESGLVRLDPSTPVVLGPPGDPTSICTILGDFHFAHGPVNPVSTDGAGTALTADLAWVTASTASPASSGTSFGSGQYAVSKRFVSMSVGMTGAVPDGQPLMASVTLQRDTSGGPDVTSTLHWTLETGAPDCAPARSGVLAINGDGTYELPPVIVPRGSYDWVITYDGDADNRATTMGSCSPDGDGDLAPHVGEIVSGSLTQPAVTQHVSSTAPTTTTNGYSTVFDQVTMTDQVSLSGTTHGTGSLVYYVSAPGSDNCNGTFVAQVPVNGDGTYTATYTPQRSGVYHWSVYYTGDDQNALVSTGCGGPDGTATAPPGGTITIAPILIFMNAPETVTTMPMTLSGVGQTPGMLRFSLYGPNKVGCDAPLAFTATEDVPGDGTYTPPPATVAVNGAYLWSVTYTSADGTVSLTTGCPDFHNTVIDPVDAHIANFLPGAPPASTPPISAFAITSSHASVLTNTITFKIAGHSLGKLLATATFDDPIKRFVGHGRHRHAVAHHRRMLYGKATESVSRTASAVTLRPTAAARAALRRRGSLSVKTTLTFTAAGSSRAVTHTVTVKVKAPARRRAPRRTR